VLDPDRQPDTDDPRPWEKPGTVRRDCLPYRSTVWDLLALAALLLGVASLCLLVPALVGLPLAVVLWRRARRDLGQMDAGLMDPSGRVSAENARGTSFAAIVVNAGALLIGGALLLAVLRP
jgi:hypothetical protein